MSALSHVDRQRSPQSVFRGRLLVGGVIVALIAVSGSAANPSHAAAKKPAAKVVFTPQRLAGKYRWVKSTVTLRFANGKSQSISLPYGPNDTISFVVKKGSGLTKASNGTFNSVVTDFGTTTGWWYLRKAGTELELVVDADDSPYLLRTIDQVDGQRLTMSANDSQILRMYAENGLDEANKVVGGAAYDELVRVK